VSWSCTGIGVKPMPVISSRVTHPHAPTHPSTTVAWWDASSRCGAGAAHGRSVGSTDASAHANTCRAPCSGARRGRHGGYDAVRSWLHVPRGPMSDGRLTPTAAVTPASIRAGQVVDLAGIATHVWAADLARAEAMAAALRVAMPVPGPPSLEVRFEHRTAPVMRPSGSAPFDIQRDGPGLVFVRGDLGLVARVDPDEIVVSGDASDLVAAFRRVFSFAVAHAFAWRHRHVLHAATLSLDEGCLLVLGPTGAGKSTVALCALHCGWPVLGDDLVALDVDGDRILATALPRPIAAPRELVDNAGAVPIPGDARERLELPPATVTPGTRPVLGVIVTTHAASPASSMLELRSFAVVPIVLASCLVADTAETRQALFPVAVQLSRLPTVELAHGTRSGARIEEGCRLLEQIRTRLQGTT
jgi:hypothetical protein